MCVSWLDDTSSAVSVCATQPKSKAAEGASVAMLLACRLRSVSDVQWERLGMVESVVMWRSYRWRWVTVCGECSSASGQSDVAWWRRWCCMAGRSALVRAVWTVVHNKDQECELGQRGGLLDSNA